MARRVPLGYRERAVCLGVWVPRVLPAELVAQVYKGHKDPQEVPDQRDQPANRDPRVTKERPAPLVQTVQRANRVRMVSMGHQGPMETRGKLDH